MIDSKIIQEHDVNCFTVDLMKKGEVPTEWNLIDLVLRQCDDEGELADAKVIGKTSAWIELSCGNPECNGKKRVRAVAMANM